MEHHPKLYKVEVINSHGQGTGAGRHYSVFSQASIEGRGVAPSDIYRTVCRQLPPLVHGGRKIFELSDIYYAFIGEIVQRRGVRRIDIRHSEKVELGDPTNNGSCMIAKGKVIPIIEPLNDQRTPLSSHGTFTIYCVDELEPGHNLVIGLAQDLDEDAAVIAAVDYSYNTAFQIKPSNVFSIRLQEASVGQIVTDFANSGKIVFTDNRREVRVTERKDGQFDCSKNPASPPLPDETSNTGSNPINHQASGAGRSASTAIPNPKDNPGATNQQRPVFPTGTADARNLSSPSEGVEPVEEDEPGEQETPFDNLRDFDTVFIIDDSSSMKGRSWRETRSILEIITSICTQYDEDGIDVYFLNHRSNQLADSLKGRSSGGYLCVKTKEEVFSIFNAVKPRNGTPTGRRLRNILEVYLRMYVNNSDSKPLNIIIITDGKASDAVEEEIVWAAQKLDRLEAPTYQVGLQFFQVGNQPGANKELRQMHDDICTRVIRDMVDTMTWDTHHGALQALTPEGILKVVTGAFDRKKMAKN